MSNTNQKTDLLEIKKYRFIVKLILTILFLAFLIIIYWFFIRDEGNIIVETPQRPTKDMNKEPESPTAYAQVDSLNTLSTSDDLGAIEADLESTNLESLTQDFNAIEAEFKN